MTTGSLLAADLVIAVLAAAGWLSGGAASAARRRSLAVGLAAFALLATLARTITIIALARAGWWFATDKILIAAPLSLAAVVVAGPRLLRPRGDIRSVAVPLLFAGYAETSALLVTVLHGYPASASAGPRGRRCHRRDRDLVAHPQPASLPDPVPGGPRGGSRGARGRHRAGRRSGHCSRRSAQS
jgi:hypothetical protein